MKISNTLHDQLTDLNNSINNFRSTNIITKQPYSIHAIDNEFDRVYRLASMAGQLPGIQKYALQAIQSDNHSILAFMTENDLHDAIATDKTQLEALNATLGYAYDDCGVAHFADAKTNWAALSHVLKAFGPTAFQKWGSQLLKYQDRLNFEETINVLSGALVNDIFTLQRWL